jgi:hypothetical protein
VIRFSTFFTHPKSFMYHSRDVLPSRPPTVTTARPKPSRSPSSPTLSRLQSFARRLSLGSIRSSTKSSQSTTHKKSQSSPRASSPSLITTPALPAPVPPTPPVSDELQKPTEETPAQLDGTSTSCPVYLEMEPLSPQLPPSRDPEGGGGISLLPSASPPLPSSPVYSHRDDETSHYHNVGDESLPSGQKRHLMNFESSFRADSELSRLSSNAPAEREAEEREVPGRTASASELGRVGDMGPPPLPVNTGASAASKRRLHRSASNISNRSSKSGRSISASNRSTSVSHRNRNGSVSTTKEEVEEEKSEERQQGITAGSSPFLPFSTGDSTGSEEPFSTPLHLSTSDNDAALENFSSSPTVAALTRNSSRSASALGPAFVPTQRSKEPEQQSSSSEEEIGLGIQRQPSARSLPGEEGAAVKSSSASTLSARIQASSSSSYGASHRKRPKFLKSRQSSSQRSSVSSMTDMHLDLNLDMDHDGASTITAGDVGGGGALSRSTSLGSIASGVTGIAGGSIYGDKNNGVSMSAAERALARLDEEERNSRRGSIVDDKEAGKGRQAKEDYKEPTTPTDQKPPLEPTDTIITAHVKSIHIPATVTREYHSRHLGGMTPGSPSKRTGAAPVLPQGKNMTLKEQSAIIDRLQKENFDLKIKVFYLNEKLEKQSDEGIKEMTKENVEMKVKLAEGMRERKSLKRRLKELEKKVEDMGGEKEGREDGEDGEIWELKERVERYEIEIEQLTRREREREERLRNDIGSKGEPARAEDVVSLRVPSFGFDLTNSVDRKCFVNSLKPKPHAENKSTLRTVDYEKNSGDCETSQITLT